MGAYAWSIRSLVESPLDLRLCIQKKQCYYSSEFSQCDLGCGTLGNMQMDVGRIQEGILWIQPEQVQDGQIGGVTPGVTIGFY